MNKIERLEQKIEELEELTGKKKKSKFKLFKFPNRLNRVTKVADRKINTVAVQYLTQNYQVKFMNLEVKSGNLVIYNNKVHVLNPETTWRYGRKLWYIIREIDRLPVSNLDYSDVKARKDDTEADVPLIKAVLGAVQKPSAISAKTAWWIIGIVVAIAAGIFFFAR